MNPIVLLLRGKYKSEVESALGTPEAAVWSAVDPAAVPSLVSYLSAVPEITHLVTETGLWSPQHMAAAAKILRARGGKFILIGKRPSSMERDIPLLLRTENITDIPGLLAKEEAPAAAPPEKPGKGRAAASPDSSPVSRKLVIPEDGEVLYITIAGSQERIGCTTQAVALVRYLQALGFASALLLETKQLDRMKQLGISFKEIGYSMRLGSVPVATETTSGLYNAYVRLIGVLDNVYRPVFTAADWSILVCGVSPQEIRTTAKALSLVKDRRYLSVLFSFADAAGAQEVARAIPYPWAAAGWAPNPWQEVPDEALRPFDTILLPWLKEKFKPQDYAWEHQKVVGV